ncbi:MAG: hypothetical protein MUE81_19130 [Thermoflexibacter sp.]|nr:hypothetical protein [Thermoflexibacter sp.]
MSNPLITIAKTNLYELEVNQATNRLYSKAIGFWRSPEALADYLADIQKAIRLLKPNFQLLNDTSELLTTPSIVQEKVIYPSVKMIQESGLAVTAIVLPKEEISKLSTTRIAGEVKRQESKLAYFSDKQEAEEWLNSLLTA